MVLMNFIFINLAAVEKTKRKNKIELQYYTGMSQREIQIFFLKKIFFFFSIFKKKIGVGRVGKTKSKLWP